MIYLPPDLPRLQTLRTWHLTCLREVDAAIAAAHVREEEHQRGLDHRPPTPPWVMEHSIGQSAQPMEVHVGGCHMAGKRIKPITREQALSALTEGLRACDHCRPDTALGLL